MNYLLPISGYSGGDGGGDLYRDVGSGDGGDDIGGGSVGGDGVVDHWD